MDCLIAEIYSDVELKNFFKKLYAKMGIVKLEAISDDYEKMKFNTAIATMMSFVNEINKYGIQIKYNKILYLSIFTVKLLKSISKIIVEMILQIIRCFQSSLV